MVVADWGHGPAWCAGAIGCGWATLCYDLDLAVLNGGMEVCVHQAISCLIDLPPHLCGCEVRCRFLDANIRAGHIGGRGE